VFSGDVYSRSMFATPARSCAMSISYVDLAAIAGMKQDGRSL